MAAQFVDIGRREVVGQRVELVEPPREFGQELFGTGLSDHLNLRLCEWEFEFVAVAVVEQLDCTRHVELHALDSLFAVVVVPAGVQLAAGTVTDAAVFPAFAVELAVQLDTE